MRMKDSDDYITARAANPRTGLITPCTPDSPGEALARKRQSQHESPTHSIKARPPLTKANEGRKISNGHSEQERGHGGGAVAPSKSLGEDRFVVHMPSAREPQPFAYPGYTPEQIEALEHYQHKTRRVSSEGYDRRLLRDRSAEVHNDWIQPPHDRVFTAYGKVPGSFTCEDEAPPAIVVRKRVRQDSKVSRVLKTATSRGVVSGDGEARGDVRTTVHSSKATHDIPSIHSHPHEHDEPSNARHHTTNHAEPFLATGDTNRKILRNLEALKRTKHSAPSTQMDPMTCPGDQNVKSARSTTRSQHDEGLHAASVTEITDLSGLPKVKLVRPEQAALPVGQRREVLNGKRVCSLGCRTEGDGGQCVGRRVLSTETVICRGSPSMNETCDRSVATDSSSRHALNKSEMFTAYLMSLVAYLGSLQLPRVGMLDMLKDPSVPLQTKAEAVKAVLSLAGHALAVCTLMAMLWKLGAVIMHLLEVVLWPLAVPLRIVRWAVIG